MKDVKQLDKKWRQSPDYQAAYDELADEFDVSRELIRARTLANLTQQELAERMHTSQSAVARLESGEGNPSMAMLKRYAEATGTHLKIELQPNG